MSTNFIELYSKGFIYISILSGLLAINGRVMAQAQSRKTIHSDQVWTQYFLAARLSDKFSLHFDMGYRSRGVFSGHSVAFVRPGLTYHITPNLNFQVGYAHFEAFFTNSEGNDVNVPEQRGWQRFNYNKSYDRFLVFQKYRLEERFIRNANKTEVLPGHHFNFRAAYQLGFIVPVNHRTLEKNTVYIQASDEIFINFGGDIVYNVFDQNRVFAGVGYQMTKGAAVLAGYQHIWQQKSDGVTINSIDCYRVSIIQNMDFRKNQ